MNLRKIIYYAFRFVYGYLLATSTASLLFSLLLTATPLFDSRFVWAPWRFFSTAFTSMIAGTVLGVPYTFCASLIAFFVFPRNKPIFLFIGMFCPSSTILLLFGEAAFNRMSFLIYYSLIPGLLAAYIYGAIGFGYGFGRWSPSSESSHA